MTLRSWRIRLGKCNRGECREYQQQCGAKHLRTPLGRGPHKDGAFGAKEKGRTLRRGPFAIIGRLGLFVVVVRSVSHIVGCVFGNLDRTSVVVAEVFHTGSTDVVEQLGNFEFSGGFFFRSQILD